MGKNEKTKKPKPKYNVWQNTAYMLSVAWDTRRSVPLLVVLLAVCTAGKTTAEMLISPAVLGKLESGAPLGQLLGAIGGFTILLFALTALCYYIDHLTMFGRCGVRLELLKRINTKRTRTAYANLLDEAFRLMYQKGHDACMNNRASGEAFWKSWTDIMTNLIGFGVYLALLSGLNPWLCVLTALTAVVSYFSTRNINEWGYRHREEGAKITRSLHYLRTTAEGREFGKDIRIFGLRQWLTDLYDSALRLNYAFLEKRERAYLTANLIDLALLLVRNGAAYAYLLWLTVTKGLPVSEFLLYFGAASGFAQWDEALVEQSFGERASERRARKTALILLGAAVLSGLVFLLFGGGPNGMAAALTSMLCMGAPLSSTLVAGIASLRLQKTAAAAGAVVPGWAAIEELGGVDTVQVDADELFTADSVNLEDIRIFKGGRIDRAILYAASILNHSCETLRGLFRQIIEDRTEILYPVKDLEVHHGLGFAAWCDNNRVLIGNRLYMEREGVPLPEQEYEDEHSQNGALQILYLAVSGSLHAMFVLHYVGGRNAARGLEVLQRENIRLLVTCEDPSLTVRHITEAYHLPEGMITLLDQEQCSALTPAQPDETARCCMLHDKGFASLIGGLRAAEKAQNAETSATTVQMVSVWFSVVIGVLLTYAGSIGTLSVAAVLMYQAAWSALSIAVCALKQHN